MASALSRRRTPAAPLFKSQQLFLDPAELEFRGAEFPFRFLRGVQHVVEILLRFLDGAMATLNFALCRLDFVLNRAYVRVMS